MKTDTAEQALARYEWIFCIINEPREIDRIKQRISNQLTPVELTELAGGLIPGSGGLHYDFVCLSSEHGRIENPAKIYDSKKFKQDRNLVRRGDVGLVKYVESILKS